MLDCYIHTSQVQFKFHLYTAYAHPVLQAGRIRQTKVHKGPGKEKSCVGRMDITFQFMAPNISIDNIN